MGAVLKVIAGLAIAAIGVIIFTRQVEPAAVFSIIRETAVWKILLVALLNFFTLYFRSLRWRFLLPDRSGVSKKELFPLVAIGFMVNNFVPLRIGEAVRALLVWRRNRFTITESVASLIIERLIDVMVFATFLCLPILLLPQLAQFRMYAWGIAGGVGGVVLFLLLYAVRPGVVASTGRFIMRFVPQRIRSRLTKIAGEAVSNLDWLFSVRKAATVAVLSYVTLFCQIGMLSVLGSDIPQFSIPVSMFGVAFAAIGAAIPLAPGYVGTLHAMVLKGLGMAGISADTAGALAIIYHAVGYVTISLLGLFFFIRLKVTFADIRRAGKLRES